MNKNWRKLSIIIFIALILSCALLFIFSTANSTPYTGQTIADTYNISVGESIFKGQSILIQICSVIKI